MAAYLSNLVAAGPDHSSALSSGLGDGLLLIVTSVVKEWTLSHGLYSVVDVELDACCCWRMAHSTKSVGDTLVRYR
jgi:hypothetical protein